MRRAALLSLLLLTAAPTAALAQTTPTDNCPGAPASNYAVIAMKPDTAFLSTEERQVVNLLIQAADQMTAIYNRQCKTAGGPDGFGHGFYPAGLTKEAFEAYVAAHPDQKAALTDGYTVVHREGDTLVAVPYSVEYKVELEKAATLLDQAAAITTNA
ncbi:MAG TPA: hypothetical protein VHL34_06045, partial [Rhizomicrobium sp.]|nr:hypothetical protein [Rhizomicrobium sp.]